MSEYAKFQKRLASWEKPLSRKQEARQHSCLECVEFEGLKNMDALHAVDFCGAWIQSLDAECHIPLCAKHAIKRTAIVVCPAHNPEHPKRDLALARWYPVGAPATRKRG